MAEQYYYGTGRRKTSVARVRLFQGPGPIVVNGRVADDYFGRDTYVSGLNEPFHVVEGLAPFSASIKVSGGGTSGQAGAIRQGIARALVEFDEGLKGPLRKAGLLTRDAREKERKKYGLKRARKAPQYTKR
jgi:small subunit ribosomal protein S9